VACWPPRWDKGANNEITHFEINSTLSDGTQAHQCQPNVVNGGAHIAQLLFWPLLCDLAVPGHPRDGALWLRQLVTKIAVEDWLLLIWLPVEK